MTCSYVELSANGNIHIVTAYFGRFTARPEIDEDMRTKFLFTLGDLDKLNASDRVKSYARHALALK